MIDPIYLNICLSYIVLYFISRNIQNPDQVVFCCFPLDVVVSVLEVSRFEQDVRSLGMALHVERAATVHEVHVRAFFRTLRGPTVRCQGLELYS